MAAKNVNACLGLGVWPTVVLIATLCAPVFLRAQNNAPPPQGAVNSTASTKSVVSVNEPTKVWIGVRGCLRQANQPHSYFMTGADGKTWELFGSHSGLSKHVGQKLDVTGYEVHNSKMKGNQADTQQNTIDNGKPYAGVQVTKIATTGESCSK